MTTKRFNFSQMPMSTFIMLVEHESHRNEAKKSFPRNRLRQRRACAWRTRGSGSYLSTFLPRGGRRLEKSQPDERVRRGCSL